MQYCCDVGLRSISLLQVPAYESSQAVPVEPPVKEEEQAFSYSDLPAPGEVAEKTFIDDLEITQLRFANNVRVNLKPTEFEDDTIYVKARFGGGTLTEPKDKPGIGFFAGHVFTEGGLEAHDIDDIRRLFSGKAANVSPSQVANTDPAASSTLTAMT